MQNQTKESLLEMLRAIEESLDTPKTSVVVRQTIRRVYRLNTDKKE